MQFNPNNRPQDLSPINLMPKVDKKEEVDKVRGQVVQPGIAAPTVNKFEFAPRHSLMQWLNIMGKSPGRHRPLQEWRTHSRQQRPGQSRRVNNGESRTEEEGTSVPDRIRPVDVMEALQFLQKDTSDEQFGHLDKDLEKKGPNRSDSRMNFYITALNDVGHTDMSPEDSKRVKEALNEKIKDIYLQTWPEIRKLMQDPGKRDEEIKSITGSSDKSMGATQRELRSGVPGSPRKDMNTFLSQITGKSVMGYLYKAFGREGCIKALSIFLSLSRPRH